MISYVVICFQISIFEPLETTLTPNVPHFIVLWFAFKLVSLNHWKQPTLGGSRGTVVVICFQISIFEPLETTFHFWRASACRLWFAFKLVSLNHWKQRNSALAFALKVVICFQISIFEPLETTSTSLATYISSLWFAFKLVSLNHWKQPTVHSEILRPGCDLLSN